MAGILGDQPVPGSILGARPASIIGGHPSFAMMYPTVAAGGTLPSYVDPYSGAVLPFTKDQYGQVSFDPNAGVIGAAIRAVSFPADALRGEIDPLSDEGVGRATETAGMAGTGVLAQGARGAISHGINDISRASRSPRLYDPLGKPPRSFAEDYPDVPASEVSVPAPGGGQVLTRDMDGRPLAGGAIAGRRMVDGGDQPIEASQLDGIAEAVTGSRPQEVPSRSIGGDAGRLQASVDPATGERRYDISVAQGYAPEVRGRVVAHELGHVLDEVAGQIPTAGLNEELRGLYSTLNTGQERSRHLTGPQHLGYRGDEVKRELMVEAIRAYMADPNYIKTVAPKTAAAIRKAVNENPRLREHIQFNTGGAPVVNTDAVEERYRQQSRAPYYQQVY